jgi:phospholipase C
MKRETPTTVEPEPLVFQQGMLSQMVKEAVFVISPWAKRGYISGQLYEHSSILKFIERRFGLPSLAASLISPPLERSMRLLTVDQEGLLPHRVMASGN